MKSSCRKPDRTEIPEFNRLWFDRILRDCERRGIRVILYSLPSPVNYNWARVRSAEALAGLERQPRSFKS